MPTSLSFTHLRFDLIARTPIKLGGYQAGARLRDALARVMLRAVCPETHRSEKPTPEHAAVCPVCWLLAHDAQSGEVRRAYSLVPPISPVDIVKTGQCFSFVITLYGDGFQYLPYFVLAVPEMGRIGIGPGHGKFDLQAIWSVNPLDQGSEDHKFEPVLLPGERVVHVPQHKATWENIQSAIHNFEGLHLPSNDLKIRFLTPTRLILGKARVKTPDFGVFFRRLLERIDNLGKQFAGMERRPKGEIQALYGLADQVHLVDASIRWADINSWSGRTKRKTPMGGFVGRAVYRFGEWEPLLPWLILGQGVQVGKLTIKGNGVYQLETSGLNRYWDAMFTMPTVPEMQVNLSSLI